MKKIVMFGHFGSGNHGSEAIIKGTKSIIDKYDQTLDIKLETRRPEEDIKYGTMDAKNCILYNENKIAKLMLKTFGKSHKGKELIYKILSKNLFSEIDSNTICMTVGGDIYCYGVPYRIYDYVERANDKGAKTILWGCSISDEAIDKKMEENLKEYTLISARETLTYENLKKHGIIDNVVLYPDPAFCLEKKEVKLPENFVEGKTIGINISPMIINYEKIQGSTIQNYNALIQYILDNTDYQIALIPHVIWNHTDDRKPIKELYEKFKNTGRIVLIEDGDATTLKGYISKCNMFIGARTHSTIAAYSTCVPTLVVGYSIKAKGIAKDLFGTYENYVIPVQTLENKEDLINAFKWLNDHKDEIKKHLNDIMPEYKERAMQAGKEILKLINE